jgi:hypothetical protein
MPGGKSRILDCRVEPSVVTLAIATRVNPKPLKSLNYLAAEILRRGPITTPEQRE